MIDRIDRFEQWLVDEIDLLGWKPHLSRERHEAEYILKKLREVKDESNKKDH